MRPYRRRHIHPKFRKLILILILSLTVLIVSYVIFTIKVMPVLCTIATAQAKQESIRTINNAVSTVLKEDDINYDKLMSFQKYANGKITAIEANSMQMNLFRYDITNEIVNRLNNLKSSNMGIPIGTIIGGPLFTNRGPKINIDIMPIGTVETNITNEFTSTGINQTRQQIMLEVKTNISIIIASYTVSTAVKSNVCVAETVIVGDVPGQYTVVEDNSGSNPSSKIFTYDPNQKK